MVGTKGRGALSNATGRFEAQAREAFDDGWDVEDLDAQLMRTEVSVEAARSIVTRNASPDIPFDRSINPYRGCEHGCVYCFARPTHAYIGLSPGLDFETRLTAKPNAPELLRAAFAKRGYKPAPIAIGANTDPYQPIENRWRIMRGLLEVFLEHRHPVTIVTKGALIMRDVDLLSALAEHNLVRVALSVTTLDRRLARRMEPRAATPSRRLEAIAALSAAGVPTAAMMAPVIPGLNDHEIEAVLEAAAQSGARAAEYVTLRLPLEVADLFKEWLAEVEPHKAGKVMRLVREMQGGRDYDPEWGKRQRGSGRMAELIGRRFAAATKRLGLNLLRSHEDNGLRTDLFRRPRCGAAGAKQLDFDFG